MAWRPFENHAEEYDLWYHRNKEILASELRLVESLGLTGLGLDVGVGSGIFANASRASVGVDPAANMLKIARRRGVDVIRAVGEHLPFRDGSFDFVITTVTLCFLERPLDVLEECKRVLRSEGCMAVCIVPRDSDWGRLYEKKRGEGHRFYKFAKLYECKEVESMLTKVGFRILEVRSTLSYPPGASPRVEEPREGFRGEGFVCIKALKAT